MTPDEIHQLIREEINNALTIERIDRFVFNKNIQILDGRNIQLGKGTGTKIGTEATQKLGVLGATPIVQQVSGADLTNSVTSGGTSDVIANYTDLTVYANDAAAIRNNIYQLARKLKQVNDAMRDFGFLT